MVAINANSLELTRVSAFLDSLKYMSKNELVANARDCQRLISAQGCETWVKSELEQRLSAINARLQEMDVASQSCVLPASKFVLERVSEFYDGLKYLSKKELVMKKRNLLELYNAENVPDFLIEDLKTRLDAVDGVLLQMDETSRRFAIAD